MSPFVGVDWCSLGFGRANCVPSPSEFGGRSADQHWSERIRAARGEGYPETAAGNRRGGLLDRSLWTRSVHSCSALAPFHQVAPEYVALEQWESRQLKPCSRHGVRDPRKDGELFGVQRLVETPLFDDAFQVHAQ